MVIVILFTLILLLIGFVKPQLPPPPPSVAELLDEPVELQYFGPNYQQKANVRDEFPASRFPPTGDGSPYHRVDFKGEDIGCYYSVRQKRCIDLQGACGTQCVVTGSGSMVDCQCAAPAQAVIAQAAPNVKQYSPGQSGYPDPFTSNMGPLRPPTGFGGGPGIHSNHIKSPGFLDILFGYPGARPATLVVPPRGAYPNAVPLGYGMPMGYPGQPPFIGQGMGMGTGMGTGMGMGRGMGMGTGMGTGMGMGMGTGMGAGTGMGMGLPYQSMGPGPMMQRPPLPYYQQMPMPVLNPRNPYSQETFMLPSGFPVQRPYPTAMVPPNSQLSLQSNPYPLPGYPNTAMNSAYSMPGAGGDYFMPS